MIDRNFEKINAKTRMGGQVRFDRSRIENALIQTMHEVGSYSDSVFPEKIFGRDVMLPYRGISIGEVRDDLDIIHILTDKVIGRLNSVNELALYVHDSPKHPNPSYTPSQQTIHDHVIHTLMQEGFLEHSEGYLFHRSLRVHLGKNGELRPEHNLFHGFPSKEFMEMNNSFYTDNGYDSIEKINELLREGKPFAEMVERADSLYKNNIRNAFQQMIDTKKNIRMLSITGKSSSGKTTSTHLLCDMIKKELGKKLVPLSIDMYFNDYQPRDARGDINYELFESLDLGLLREHIPRLIAGEKVLTPIYNFKKSRREPESEWQELQVDEDSILVVDSHCSLIPVIREALDPKDNPSITEDQRFYVYLEPFNHIHDMDDNLIHMSRYNMLRRWRRDREHRDTAYEFNIPHWWAVRKGELRDIVPRMNLADVVINSGIPGELNFMARVMQEEFELPNYEQFLENEQLYGAIRCYQGQKLLNEAIPVPQEYIDGYKVLPGDSLLREFVGNSVFAGKHI
ncbi:hypothetical protein H6503_04400 [Candidatus Woesearchaeota archaeon]|nr:hypothetical protein [Candidatus Woesearchaeota archaeon]